MLIAATPQAAMKLRPGAGGKLCLGCHQPFEKTLKKAFVHTPLRGGECIACHNPHASEHGKLLSGEAGAVCARCHERVVPQNAKSVHKPVSEGACLGCHDPHASDNKFELRNRGNEGCATCHASVVEASARAKVGHAPVQQGCATCHDPHGSGKASSLLRAAEPELCLSCHRTLNSAAHAGYPVARAACSGCHDPHGSDRKGMLYASVHKPVADRQCSSCHAEASSKQPLQARLQGIALCRDCHSVQVGRMLDASHVHWPLTDGASCLNCHSPHASKQPGLLSGRQAQVCGSCHADTLTRQEQSPTKHVPVRDGSCTSCHEPHASEGALLLRKANVAQVCQKCHDYGKHSSHPMGENLRDGRNRNLGVDCLSCHRAHGTEFKHMALYATSTELCTECHEKFKR